MFKRRKVLVAGLVVVAMAGMPWVSGAASASKAYETPQDGIAIAAEWAQAPVVAAYFANWNTHRADYPYSAANIPADKLTHVFYAFGGVTEAGECALRDAKADVEEKFPGDSDEPGALRGNFHQLKLLKEKHPHLRTAIALAGWGDSLKLAKAAETTTGRQKYVKSCVDLFLKKWPGVFDGFDVDWEFPVHGGSYPGPRPEDRHNSTLLFQEMRKQLDALGKEAGKRYLLTAAYPAGRQQLLGEKRELGDFDPDQSFELKESAKILDWINLMTYDMANPKLTTVTNHNSPLAANPADPTKPTVKRWNNAAGAIEYFASKGVPAHKIALGVPFFGYSYQGVADQGNGLFQPFQPGKTALRYPLLTRDYLPTYQKFWDKYAQVPWLYSPQTRTFVSYDDPQSIGIKMDFVKRNRLRGAMIWEISQDDPQNTLISAVSKSLLPRRIGGAWTRT